MPRTKSCLLLILLATYVSQPGCGESGPPTYAVAGTVTLNGTPLAEGTLSLVPMQSGSGIPAIDIVAGEFHCPAEQGPTDGVYRVEINAYEKTGRMVEDPDLIGHQMEETKRIIPRQYNLESTLTLELPADNAETLEYALKSR